MQVDNPDLILLPVSVQAKQVGTDFQASQGNQPP
jgi:hypothetical protein